MYNGDDNSRYYAVLLLNCIHSLFVIFYHPEYNIIRVIIIIYYYLSLDEIDIFIII